MNGGFMCFIHVTWSIFSIDDNDPTFIITVIEAFIDEEMSLNFTFWEIAV